MLIHHLFLYICLFAWPILGVMCNYDNKKYMLIVKYTYLLNRFIWSKPKTSTIPTKVYRFLIMLIKDENFQVFFLSRYSLKFFQNWITVRSAVVLFSAITLRLLSYYVDKLRGFTNIILTSQQEQNESTRKILTY